MVYIQSSSSISIQDPETGLQKATFPAELHLPTYKERISPVKMRRMGAAVRMGIWTALEAGATENDPIIMGSGMGCLKDSEKFLEGLRGAPDTVSPTPFIQSTHNTVSGQIALNLGNHLYNITHVQNGVSFEASLIDGMMWLAEKGGAAMVGGVEEHIPLLTEIAQNLNLPQANSDRLNQGGAFIKIDAESGNVKITDCSIIADLEEAIEAVKNAQCELILAGNSGPVEMDLPSFGPVPTLNFVDYTGIHMSNSAQAADMAFQILNGKKIEGHAPNSICIFNQYLDRSYGVTICEKS